MSQTNAQNRKLAVQAITKRNAIQGRIDRTQRRIQKGQDKAERAALLQSLAADQIVGGVLLLLK